MIAMKFGGTSMGSADNIARVAQIIQQTLAERKEVPVVVVSAMSGTTNDLLAAANAARAADEAGVAKALGQIRVRHEKAIAQLFPKEGFHFSNASTALTTRLKQLEAFLNAIVVIGKLSATCFDEILSTGEWLAACILAEHLEDIGARAAFVDLSAVLPAGTHTEDDDHSTELIGTAMKKAVAPHLANKRIAVCTGFFGRIPGGILAQVGRGYSDFCVSLLGACANAAQIHIWTDVDGMLSADPRLIRAARVLPEISFAEAGELAQFGAKVLHPQTIWPAVKRDIPVRIKNTLNPQAPGTLITRTGKTGNHLCKSVAKKEGVTLILITSARMLMATGFLGKVFGAFADHGVAVDLVSTGEISLTASIFGELPPKLLSQLQALGKVEVLTDMAIVCAVGTELHEKPGVAARLLGSVAAAGVRTVAMSQSAMKINISIVVEAKDADTTLHAMHDALIEV